MENETLEILKEIKNLIAKQNEILEFMMNKQNEFMINKEKEKTQRTLTEFIKQNSQQNQNRIIGQDFIEKHRQETTGIRGFF